MILVVRAFVVWLVLLTAAVLNGAIRQRIFVPAWGEPTAHAISTLMLSAAIFGLSAAFAPFLALQSAKEAWLTGGFWLWLTLAFEFLAGHYIFRTPWTKLFADYDLSAGRIWILVLVATLLSPRLVLAWR